MPAIPFIVVAVESVSAGVAAAGAAAVSAGGAITAGVATVGGATAFTIGATTITVGHVLGAAAALGIGKKIIESLNESDRYLSDDEKDFEERKLKRTLAKEVRFLRSLQEGADEDLEEEIEEILSRVEELQDDQQYFSAIKICLEYKLLYAQKEDDTKLAAEVKSLAKELCAVREETNQKFAELEG